MYGNKAMLLNQYFATLDQKEILIWSKAQEQELLNLKNNNIDMKETAGAVSTKQMANVVCININLLSTPEKTRLRDTLHQEQI